MKFLLESKILLNFIYPFFYIDITYIDFFNNLKIFTIVTFFSNFNEDLSKHNKS